MKVDTHKLKTPLTVIFGYSQLLLSKGENLTEKQKNWIEEILKEAKRLRDMIDELA